MLGQQVMVCIVLRVGDAVTVCIFLRVDLEEAVMTCGDGMHSFDNGR